MKLREVEQIGPFSDLLSSAEDNAENGYEMDFVAKIREGYSKWGEEMFISETQYAFLERLAG